MDRSKILTMRSPARFVTPALLGALLGVGALSSGCAHTLESAREDRVVIAVDNKPEGLASSTEVTQAPPVIAIESADSARSRPRLSQTVTLGQGTTEPVYAQPAPQNAQGTNGNNVVVNNNITVVGGQPQVYGGYGGYGGYGYRDSSYNSGVGYGMRDSSGRGNGSHSAYAPSGWEGAGRTAAPGQTPHVGGNWSPAPSHGPRQMK